MQENCLHGRKYSHANSMTRGRMAKTAIPEHHNTAAMLQVPNLFKGTWVVRTVALLLGFCSTFQVT